MGVHGSISPSVARRLFYSYDDRFSTSNQLIFLLGNQYLRHSACRAVNFKLKDNSEVVDEFTSIVNEPGVLARLERCRADLASPDAKKLLKKIMPLVNITGSKIPWGPLERKTATTHLYSMAQAVGAPFMFVTFSPKVIENELCLQFACSQDGKTDLATLRLNGNVGKRGLLLSTNPITAARAFEAIVQAFMDHLVGVSSTSTTRNSPLPRPGIFGPVTSAYGIHEVQGRGILHLHMLLFGSLDPAVVQRCCDDPLLKKQFCRVIDSIASATLEGHEDIRENAKRLRQAKDRQWQKNRVRLGAKGLPSLLEDSYDEDDEGDEGDEGDFAATQVPLGLKSPVDPVEYKHWLQDMLGKTFVDEEADHSWTVTDIVEDLVTCTDAGGVTSVKPLDDVKPLFQLQAIERSGQEVAATFNFHIHTRTCHKTNSKKKS